MKYLLILFLFSITTLAFGQSSVDFGQFINIWTKGIIDQNGNVVQAEISRGGSCYLIINSDTTVTLGARACGYGYKRNGTWQLNKMDSTTTFTFSSRVGYNNSSRTDYINEIEIYKIKKITVDELILSRTIGGTESIIPFIRTTKSSYFYKK